MSCCGGRGKLPQVKVEQKWEYINLDDFHSTSCWTVFSYGILYISLFISVAVYAVDTFTAVNLLAFARWSGEIKPFIPLEYSRWIFAGCIILSFVLLFFRWLRAIRVMKDSAIARSYLDPLAVRVQSVRMGKRGRGWKRFLVFAELTKGKKGADYIALFTYFSFEAWLRILFAEGPRQVINALTLYSVMQLNLIPTGENSATDGHSPFVQFFVNVGILADKSGRNQAAILFGMLFTLVVWVVTLINLFVAVLFYVFFLFHHIPSSDRGLTGYCWRKINKSMDKIVKKTCEKALRRENAQWEKEKESRGPGGLKKQPTLPSLDPMPGETPLLLSRQTTLASLSDHRPSRPGTSASSGLTSPSSLEGQQPPLPDPDAAGFPTVPLNRVDTSASSTSWKSYGSNAPLMAGAAGIGHGPSRSMRGPGALSHSSSYSSRSTSSRSHPGYAQSVQRSYTPGGIGQTPSEQSNPYFPPVSNYPARASSTALPHSDVPGDSTASRSITPAASYDQRYNSGSVSLGRDHTYASSTGPGYQNYSGNFDSPTSSSFTPQSTYRPYTPFDPRKATPDYRRQQTPEIPQSSYAARPRMAHMPPSQRTDRPSPPNRQLSPATDDPLDDIIRGY